MREGGLRVPQCHHKGYLPNRETGLAVLADVAHERPILYERE
jgi:hypothetical protein